MRVTFSGSEARRPLGAWRGRLRHGRLYSSSAERTFVPPPITVGAFAVNASASASESVDSAWASGARIFSYISEVLVDTYDSVEELSAWSAVSEDALDAPFTTTVLGLEVTVTGLELPLHGDLRAVCVVAGHRQRIALTDFPLPEPPPAGAEWVAAYRLWSGSA